MSYLLFCSSQSMTARGSGSTVPWTGATAAGAADS